MKNEKNAIGFICECNPYHEGHKFILNQIQKMYESPIIIAIMSGNFVQRGEPAVYDKYTRAKWLIENGVSVVIELPVEYVLSSAKYFALGAISILNSLKIIDYLVFGSEICDINLLNDIANVDISNDINIKTHIKNGLTYAKALSLAYNINLSPNDILAVEYIHSLNILHSSIIPIAIRRNDDFPSATTIRKNLQKNVTTNSFSQILTKTIYDAYANDFDLTNIYNVNTALSHRILNTKNMNITFDDRAQLIKSKNNTLASVKRALFNLILNIKKEDVATSNISFPYLHILGIKKDLINYFDSLQIPYMLSLSDKSYSKFAKKYDISIDNINCPMHKNAIYSSNLYYLLSNENATDFEYKKQAVII